MLQVSLVCALLDSTLTAQETPPPPPPDETPANAAVHPDDGDEGPFKIIVTATRHPDSSFDVPVGSNVITRKEIEEKNARNAAEALRYQPGIWVQKTGHIGGAPILRGFMGNRVLYMFDGIRRNTAGLFAGPNSFLQNIDALDIDRIEVVRGPGSVLYGSDAIGGVINVITNEKPVFSAQPKLGGSLTLRGASVDHEKSGRVEASVSTPNSFGFAGGTRRHFGNLRAGGGDGAQVPSHSREVSWDAQYDYRVDEHTQAEVFVQEFSRPQGTRFDRPDWRQSNDRELIGLRIKANELEGSIDAIEGTAYFHDQRGFIDEKFWDSDTQDKTYGIDLQATSYPDETLRLIYGVHYHQDDIAKSNPQKGTVDPNVDWENPAAYMLSEWQASERFRIDLGLRWDQFRFRSRAPSLSELDPTLQTAIGNGAFALDDLSLNETDDAFTGGLGGVYELTDTVNLVGHVGRAFRAPNKADQLSFGQFSFGFGVPSQGNLDPESSWTYEAGVKVDGDEFAGSLTGFSTVVDNAIVSLPGVFNGSDFVDVNGNGTNDPGETVFIKQNSDGKLRVHGIEAEARQWFPESLNRHLIDEGELSWFGNGTWIIGKDTGTGEPLDRGFPANVLLGVRLDQDRDASKSRYWWSLDTWLVRNFDRIPSTRLAKDPAFKQNPQDKTSPLLRADGSVPGFAVVNLRGGRKLSDRVRVAFGIENIFDRKYRVKDSRLDGPGRNAFLGVYVRF